MENAKVRFWNVDIIAEDIESGQRYAAMVLTVQTDSPLEACDQAIALCRFYDDIHEGYKHYLDRVGPA